MFYTQERSVSIAVISTSMYSLSRAGKSFVVFLLLSLLLFLLTYPKHLYDSGFQSLLTLLSRAETN